MNITIFTDGSSRGNPGPGGWGAIVATEDTVAELGGGEKHTTNNRMELTAVIRALEFVSKIIMSPDTMYSSTNNLKLKTTIYLDSSYVMNGATKWIHRWQKKGWKTATKDDVLNKDLWEELAELLPHLAIEWKLIKGHSGIEGNERCDIIATSFADGTLLKLHGGTLSDYGIDISVSKANSTKLKKKSSSKKSIAYSYVSSLGGVVKTHKTWAECEARVKGKSDARFKKAFSKEEEQELTHSWMKSI